jgi:hypothetical protein
MQLILKPEPELRAASLRLRQSGQNGRPESGMRRVIGYSTGLRTHPPAPPAVSLRHRRFTSRKPKAPTQLVPTVVSPTGSQNEDGQACLPPGVRLFGVRDLQCAPLPKSEHPHR